MPLDFFGQNLRGRSFKGQDLSGANFSHADIRGADFTNALLRNANFQEARAGIQPRWVLALASASWLLSALSGVFLGFSANLVPLILSTNVIKEITIIPGLATLFVLIGFLVITYRKGIGVALNISAVSISTVSIIASIFAGVVANSASFTIAGTLIFAVAGITSAAITTAMAIAVGPRKIAGFISIFITTIYAAIVTLMAVSSNAISAVCLITALTMFSCYIGWRDLYKEEGHDLVRSIAIVWASWGGTSFRRSDLTRSNFANATLRSADFRNARLNNINWRGSKRLEFARVDNSVLSDSEIRKLLITGNGHGRSYIGADLQNVNLECANLQAANLRSANLSRSTLNNTDLSHSNLTEVLATGTDFEGANLTGACIQSWNIDSTTNLKDVHCQYIYLLENPNELGSHERRPHDPSKIFDPGDFSHLFTDALNTIDLLFREGLDTKAFAEAYRKVQVMAGDRELSIQSIEKKGDGNVLLTFSVPSEIDKSEISRQFLELYNLKLQDIKSKYMSELEAKYKSELEAKSREIEAYRQESNYLKEIVKVLVAKPPGIIEYAAKPQDMIIDSEQQAHKE